MIASIDSPRCMATIRVVEDIIPIPNADNIVQYKIKGWKVVGRKDEFNLGDLVIYCEIDSFISEELAPFLTKNNKPQEYQGIKGNRLRTIKLRGVLSQGLLLSVNYVDTSLQVEGTDVSRAIDIVKWEMPVPAQLQGQIKGSFPPFVPKTDQERIQNINLDEYRNTTYQVTEKIHGSSITIYYHNQQVGVCSRNLNLKEDGGDSYWRTTKRLGIDVLLKDLKHSIAIQGELYGEGVNGNQYNHKGLGIAIYDIFDIISQEYWSPSAASQFCYEYDLQHVPILISQYAMFDCGDKESLLSSAEGDSILTSHLCEREGLVFKSNTLPRKSFKVVSNRWLLDNY